MATVEHLMFVQWGVGPNFNTLSPLLVPYCIIMSMSSSQVFLCKYLLKRLGFHSCYLLICLMTLVGHFENTRMSALYLPDIFTSHICAIPR